MFLTVVTAITQPAKPVFSTPVPTASVPTAPVPTAGFDILLRLHLPGKEVAFTITHFTLNLFTLPQEKLKLNPREVAAYEEVSNYLAWSNYLADPYSWITGTPTLSPEAQTAFTISLQRLTIELTGGKLASLNIKMRTEVVAYLALIKVCSVNISCLSIRRFHSSFTQNVVNVMAASKNWQVAAKDYPDLEKLNTDITTLVSTKTVAN